MSNQVEKVDIIKSLVASGLTLEEAESAYLEAFAPKNSGVKLPYNLIKVNNDATVADMGALVADPIKNEKSGDVEGYNEIYHFEEVEFLMLDRAAMWSKFDGNTGRTTVKTELLPTFSKTSAYIDSFSGVDITTLKEADEDIKYQHLALVGVRPRGTNEKFKFYNMYIKGAMLYNINQLMDTCSGSQYVVLEAITKTSKKGSVKYTEFDLGKSLALPLPAAEVLGNVMEFLDAKTKYSTYVKAYNEELGIGKDEVATGEEAAASGLPA